MKKPPNWASFLSASAYRHLMRCVEDELGKRGLAYELQEDAVYLPEQGIIVGLVNLAQRCRASVPPRWPGLVAFLFDQVLASSAQGDVVRELAADPARGIPHLRVQLQSEQYLRELPRDRLMVAPCNAGRGTPLWRCLAWDLSASVSAVGRDEVAGWGRTDEELFAIGLENVRTLEPVTRLALEWTGAPHAFALHGDSHYVASHALLLEEPTLLVWVPNRHTVLCAPADASAEVVEAIGARAARAFRDGPGSISPDRFLWEQRRLSVVE